MNSAEKMKAITRHVERSTQEQTRGSRQITRAIEAISEMVAQLSQSQREQTQHGDDLGTRLAAQARDAHQMLERVQQMLED